MKIQNTPRYFIRLTLAPRRARTLEFIRPGIAIAFPQPDNPVHLLQQELARAFEDDPEKTS